MTKNRFLLQAGDYDLAYEFRVADLTRVERTIEDFWNEEEEVYEFLEYLNYLYMNGSFLTMEEAKKIFNGLHEENEELRHKLSQQEMEYATDLHRLAEENEELKQKVDFYKYFQKDARELEKENEQLKSENKRLTDKLNKTALELVDGVISQGKATEISEMSYREFLDYRAKNGKPMELQK